MKDLMRKRRNKLHVQLNNNPTSTKGNRKRIQDELYKQD